ncbi:transmembrane protein 82 isoform X3 [Eleginops maclovinus]|uniref:transmembrane protein 82 isoform X3 n=1 Tax=Eleginops maclovinus TaxID=56733 RepID=UPI00307FF7B4
MFSFIRSLIPTSYFLPAWLTLDINPVDSLLQGLVAACGISVLCSFIRLHLFLEEESCIDKNDKETIKRTPSHQSKTKPGLFGMLHFLFVTGMLAVVGSRVASLVVLEFCLRAVSGLFTAGPATRLLQHVTALYKLHSSQRYCGICIGLLSSGRCVLPMLCRAMIITFSVAVVAAIFIINQQFLSATEALRFWTPLTICYTLLVVYMQEEQHRLPGSQAVLNTVVVRLGGLMVLMLTVGRWADVLHIIMCFLGEAGCLIPTMDLLDAASSQEEEDYREYVKREHRRRPKAQEKEHQR